MQARPGTLGALSVLIESEPKLQILVLTRFLPQISLRNLRKLDCYANRYPLRSKTLLVRSTVSEAVGRQKLRHGGVRAATTFIQRARGRGQAARPVLPLSVAPELQIKCRRTTGVTLSDRAAHG